MDRNIIATQTALFQAARRRRKKRFDRLARLIARSSWITAAAHEVLRLPGARTAGVDHKTREDYEAPEQRQQLAEEIDEFLQGHYYLPFPMRPVRIPKRRKKGYRTIFVPTIRDRVIGHLLKMVLEPIFEADFVQVSQGFRPGRGRMDSIIDCRRFISAEHRWILLADIRQCFSSINQAKLIQLLRNRVADEKVIDMIWAFLEAGACDRGFEIELTPGVPAGFPLASLLMNVYLHEVDKWSGRAVHPVLTKNDNEATRFIKFKMTRYADNILFVSDTAQDAINISNQLTRFLSSKLGLELSQSDICDATQGFTFLGFQLQLTTSRRKDNRLIVTIPAARIEQFKNEVTNLLQPYTTPIDTITHLNQTISGFGSEFRFVNSGSQFRVLDRWIERKYNEGLTLGGAGSVLGGSESIDGMGAARLTRLCEIKREPYRPVHRRPFEGQENDWDTGVPTNKNFQQTEGA